MLAKYRRQRYTLQDMTVARVHAAHKLMLSQLSGHLLTSYCLSSIGVMTTSHWPCLYGRGRPALRLGAGRARCVPLPRAFSLNEKRLGFEGAPGHVRPAAILGMDSAAL